jgi:hypothetical protein
LHLWCQGKLYLVIRLYNESQYQVLQYLIFGTLWFEFGLLQTLGSYNSDHLPEGTYI